MAKWSFLFGILEEQFYGRGEEKSFSQDVQNVEGKLGGTVEAALIFFFGGGAAAVGEEDEFAGVLG